jgi:uncharacterized membrane protein SirB2
MLRSRFLREAVVLIQALHLLMSQIGKLVHTHLICIGLGVVVLNLVVVLRENLKTRPQIRFGSVSFAILSQELHECLLFFLMH